MTEAIKFEASIYKVQTLADHGVRVTLDLPEDAIPQMAMLAEAQRQGIYLHVVCSDYLDSEVLADGRTRRKRSSQKG